METNDHLEASGIDTGNDTGSNPATDAESTTDMDDTTGSNGGSTEGHFSGESDDTGDSSYQSRPPKSRSDSARVDSPGLSGDSSNSGGRSQY